MNVGKSVARFLGFTTNVHAAPAVETKRPQKERASSSESRVDETPRLGLWPFTSAPTASGGVAKGSLLSLLRETALGERLFGHQPPPTESVERDALGLAALIVTKNGLGFDPAQPDLKANPDIAKAFAKLLRAGKPIDTEAVATVLIPAARDFAVETPSEKRALLYLIDVHGERFTAEARRMVREDVLRYNHLDQLAGGFKTITGSSPHVVNDAGGLEPTIVREVVRATSPDDVRNAIARAKASGVKLSIAGRRHTEGGHTISPGGIQVDMMAMNRMQLKSDGVLKVEAGATWAQIQALLAPLGRSVKVMQSSNIFTVGGSLGANCHGRAPGLAPLAHCVRQLRVMQADGVIVTCSRSENPELFKHVIGGYGLFGVVLDVELETVPDMQCEMTVSLIKESDYLTRFENALAAKDTELAYGRLDPNLSGEVMFHEVKRIGAAPGASSGNGSSIESGTLSALGKAALWASKHGPDFLEARWALEKAVRKEKAQASRNEFMSPNIEFLNQYWFDEGRRTDILQEYYVPRAQFQTFVDGLRTLQTKHKLQSLNVTIRDVGKDVDSALSYAKADSFAFVLYYNQAITPEDDKAHQALGSDLVDLAAKCGGTFYLPYRPTYNREQLARCYPEIDSFFAYKRKVDPDELFSNKWFERYASVPSSFPAPR